METKQSKLNDPSIEQICNAILLPDEVVQRAISGDVDAINEVLSHCEHYLTLLSLCELQDKDGNVRLCLDMEKKQRLETKIIVKLLQANPRNIA